MMKRLIYENERGDRLIFSTASEFHVNIDKDVTGLSEISNDIVSIISMGQDGNTEIGSRIKARDIEIVGHINMRDKDLIHRTRRRMNRILNPQFTGLLIFEFGNIRRVISCSVQEASPDVANPVLPRFIIQVFCSNPFWREDTETRQDIATWIGGFEFPIDRADDDLPQGLEIPIDPDDPTEPTWEIGWREPSLIVNVFNGGDVRAGMRIDFRALGYLDKPFLLNVVTGEFIRMNTDMQAGDVITINTAWGEKGITLRRAGVTTDAFRYLDPDSRYLQLAVGDNIFRYDAEENMYNLDVTIHHNNLYLGV
ncbi:MAG: phage tail family protein [Defluviitaleaceae bacterium]|nr:phage tail family protein [Defluviitaleaceae bacterium]MCL2835794.1 phage tail family protein [Defluviitaleaceae bacterium]